MSEKQQHNDYLTQLKMLNNYGDEHQHKHNKSHLSFRKHFKSHPVQIQRIDLDHMDMSNMERSTGLIRKEKLKKTNTKPQRHHESRDGWHS